MEIVLFGFLFGAILMYAKLNRFNTISGLAILEDLAVVKTIVLAIVSAILNIIIFSSFAAYRPIAASTSFPYLADYLSGFTANAYFNSIVNAEHWEVLFLGGAFLAGLVISILKKEFQFKLIYSNWERFKGNSKSKRIIWSLLGGFILIFGARMAGGCTSGHILSEGIQLAISSLVFAIFTFIGLLITGKLFYTKKIIHDSTRIYTATS